MRDFFRGWRRKAGCATLVMACVLTIGWLRSFAASDILQKELTTDARFNLIEYRCLSTDGVLYLNREALPKIDDMWGKFLQGSDLRNRTTKPLWRTLTNPSRNKAALAEVKSPELKWGFSGFGIHYNKFRRTIQVEMLRVEYWSIVTPLTALSGYLLLSKPRHRQQVAPSPEKAA